MPVYNYNHSHINISNTDYVSVVRFLIADTDVVATNTGDVSDEEITALYSDTSTGDTQAQRNILTAYTCAKYILTKYRKQVTFSSAGTSVNLSDRVAHWESMVTDLATKVQNAYGYQSGMTAKRCSSFID